MAGAQHVAVTGASGGIGASISESLARSGCAVTVMGRNRKALEVLASRISRCHIEVCDVTDTVSVESAFAGCRRAFGSPGILVNCAGSVTSGPITKLTLNTLRETVDVNLIGAFLCLQQVLPDMIGQGFGRIINVASSAALKGYPYVSAYCAAKHGLLGLTRSVAVELAKTGVTVNAVCPGYTDTGMLETSVAEICRKSGRGSEEVRGSLAGVNPQGRFVRPDEVASVISFLAFDAPASINGVAIPVTGGEIT